jgi:ABC-type dipeptide/oligopeptide/nickel transport system permease component
LLGIIFGIIALVQIGKNPSQKGKGLAIAGIIISVIWIPLFLMLIGAFAYFGVLSPERFMPSKCMMIGGFSCMEHTISGGTAVVTLQNNVGIDVEKATLKLESECTPKDTAISNGATMSYKNR